MNTEQVILDYCASKGYDFLGRTALSAIKEQLASENGGMRLPVVENAHRVDVLTIPLHRIQVGNRHHYENVDPRPVQGVKGAPLIAGVLVKSNNSGYRLVDGYHRLKWLREKSAKSGEYIVLFFADFSA